MSSPNDKAYRVRISKNEPSLKVQDLELEVLRPDPNQPRKVISEDGLRELAASIERHGLLQPVTVKRDKRKKGNFVLVAGERRYRAFELLGRAVIPAVITTGDADEIALIENLQREDLAPIEEAEALARLKKKHSYTVRELGSALGKSKTEVGALLKINDLPRKIRSSVPTSGQGNRSFLIELAQMPNKKDQLKLWEEVRKGNLTVRELRRKKRESKSKEVEASSDLRRVLTTGKRFISDIARLTETDMKFTTGEYEEILEMYESFISLVEKVADSTQGKS